MYERTSLAPTRRLDVLVVDDDVVDRALLADTLRATACVASVRTAASMAGATRWLEDERFDVIAVDLRRGASEGARLIEWMRGRSLRIPLVEVTETPGETRVEDRVALDFVGVVEKPGARRSHELFTRDLARVMEVVVANADRPAAPRRLSAMRPVGMQSTPLSGHSPSLRAAPRDVVAIAASTGGPLVLTTILRELPARFSVPILLTQHIPHAHVEHLLVLLREASNRPARVPDDGEPLLPGTIYVAGHDRHLTVDRAQGALVARRSASPPENHCRPAADPMFRAVATHCGARSLGVVLTGLGCDGAAGALAMSRVGATILAQDQATSVVFGMPGATVQAGAAHLVLPTGEMARWIQMLTL